MVLEDPSTCLPFCRPVCYPSGLCWVTLTLSVTHQSYAREIAPCLAHHSARRAPDDAPAELVLVGALPVQFMLVA